jgi:hypothetical protein
VPILVLFGRVVAGHLNHGPVVVPGALGPLPGAHPVPGAGGDHADGFGCRHGAARPGCQGVVGADCHHIAHPAPADTAAQFPAAVHLIASHEGGADPARVRAVQQPISYLRLAGEHHLLWDAGQLAVLLIGGARLGQVQGPADQRMPAAGGIGQGDRHLAQRDTAHGAAVLAGGASGVGRGFLVGGLIHDQHRIPVIEVADRPVRRDVKHLLVVPDRTRQQMLQPVRPAMPGRLGDRPAVVIFQLHQQPADHLAAGLPGLPPGKAPGHLSQQIRQQRGLGLIRYRGSSGCRILIESHNPS